MAIGDTVQAGLMRIDTSAYERAGQANANANMAFGNALNQVAKGFIEGQEKKARAEEMTGYLMNQGVSEKDAKAIAKNPFLQKEYQRKKATEAQMQMEGNRLQMEAQKLAAQQKQSSDQAFQKNREMDMKEELFRTQQDKNREAEESATNIAKFNLDRPELPITEETPAAFLPELDPDPFVGPPTTYQGQAPAVAQLPESFQPQGAQVVDAVQSGQLSLLEGNRIMNSIRGQAMAEQKAGPKPMTPIQEAELKKLNLANRKAEFELSDLETPKTDYKAGPTIVEDNIFRALDIIKESPRTTTGMGSYLSNIPGTDAKSLKERLASIKANIGFDYLQAMREASPTGGALGNVSDKELQGLQSVFGSLEQSLDDAELTYNLNLLNYTYNNVIHGEGNHNVLDPRKGGSSQSQQPTPQSRDELLKQEADLQRRLNERLLNNPPVQQFRGI